MYTATAKRQNRETMVLLRGYTNVLFIEMLEIHPMDSAPVCPWAHLSEEFHALNGEVKSKTPRAVQLAVTCRWTVTSLTLALKTVEPQELLTDIFSRGHTDIVWTLPDYVPQRASWIINTDILNN